MTKTNEIPVDDVTMSDQGNDDGLGSLDRLFSLRTVCGLLDTSDRTLRRLIASGKFPNADRRLGRELRWKCSTIQRYLSENESGTGCE